MKLFDIFHYDDYDYCSTSNVTAAKKRTSEREKKFPKRKKKS